MKKIKLIGETQFKNLFRKVERKIDKGDRIFGRSQEWRANQDAYKPLGTGLFINYPNDVSDLAKLCTYMVSEDMAGTTLNDEILVWTGQSPFSMNGFVRHGTEMEHIIATMAAEVLNKDYEGCNARVVPYGEHV